ncbi:hypothetical protein J0B02_04335 [Enterobacteriaceae bacterium YMB-R22]|nr:hypothetical protein [Tenebrionicola larvae]
MKNKQLWINQIKGLYICLVAPDHSVIAFYPHIPGRLQGNVAYILKRWIYGNACLAPLRMPYFLYSRLPDNALYRLHDSSHFN